MKTLAAMLLASASLAAVPVVAADFPDRPIQLLVPFAAGGPNDTVARLIAPRLSEILGQSVLIENRNGAGGVVGTDAVAKAEPDGYMIGISSAGALAISSSVNPAMPYDPATDLTPLTLLGTVPELLVVNPQLDATNVEELIAYAKANPGTLNYASSGQGGMQHLAGEMLNLEAGIDAVHVPYNGAAPAVTELLGEQVQMMFADLPVLLPYIQDESLRPIAVGSPSRSDTLPDVPTMAEAGLPAVEAENWYGIVAPKGLPDEVETTLLDALQETLNDPAIRDALAANGVEVVASSPEELAEFMATEREKWARVISESGAVVQ